MQEVFETVFGIADVSFLFSFRTQKSFSLKLRQAGWELTGKAYLSSSLVLSLFLSLLSFLFYYGFSADTLASLLALFLVLAFSLCFFYVLPAYLSQKRAEEMEREFSVCLPSLAAELELGIPFEEALKNAAGGGFGVLSEEFGKLTDAVEWGGHSVPKALERMSENTSSLAVKRVCSQLAWVYVKGEGEEDLRKYAEALVGLQQQKFREFRSQFAMAGVVFVVFSVLAPAFFSSAVALGAFLGWRFSATDIFIAYAFLFPAVDLALLLYVYEKTPKLLSL